MDSAESLRTFFGWCSVINIGILMLAGIGIMSMRSWMSGIHGALFGLDETDLARAYFQYLAQYKIAIFVLNFVPYLALCMMT